MKARLILLQLTGVVFAGCFLAAAITHGDPMLAFELAGAAAVLVWAVIVAWNTARAALLARELGRVSRPLNVAGVACRVISSGRREAFAIGLRPTIFISEAAVGSLDRQQLRAVILHEDHHRRTLAPLRAAALEGWLALAGRFGAVRRPLTDRLAALETSADRHALRHGVSPGSLASALLKMEQGAVASRFTGHADRRVGQLLAVATGEQHVGGGHLPIELLPPVMLIAMIIGCRLAGADTPI